MKQKIFIGIGSNIGNSIENCLISIDKLAEDKRICFISKSSMYLTSPVSIIQQNDFINCAACITWDGSPLELLHILNSVEKMMGRERNVKDGPRIIDLDILLFGNLIIDTLSLKIPHPELHKRKFAIAPCIEIDPTIIHPVFGKELKDFLIDINDNQKIELLQIH